MNEVEKALVHRILVIDDNPNIHKDFQTILLEEQESTTLDALRNEVFGDKKSESQTKNIFELDFASQGKEGVEKVQQACSENQPYELAFVDMRMPPGWDGLKTIEEMWQVDPKIQVVICTAYSDYSWGEITERLGKSDNLLILKKPFDSAEVAQLASALTEKWVLAGQASLKTEQLQRMVKDRTDELAHINEQLKAEIGDREQAQQKQAELIRTVDAANKDLRDFASMISHDLKAPLRGIKTLALRMRQHCENALAVARWLQTHPKVTRVFYPGLPSHPQHGLAERLFQGLGYGGMVAFDLVGADQAQVFRFFEALRLCLPATTLGDVYTLVLYPAHSSHRALSAEERAAIGIGDGLVRLSVGIEAVEDLLGDLEQALDALP